MFTVSYLIKAMLEHFQSRLPSTRQKDTQVMQKIPTDWNHASTFPR